MFAGRGIGERDRCARRDVVLVGPLQPASQLLRGGPFGHRRRRLGRERGREPVGRAAAPHPEQRRLRELQRRSRHLDRRRGRGARRSALRRDAPGFAAQHRTSSCLFRSGSTSRACPVTAVANPGIVHATLYLQKTCPTQNVALFALSEVTVNADGTCDRPNGGEPPLNCGSAGTLPEHGRRADRTRRPRAGRRTQA